MCVIVYDKVLEACRKGNERFWRSVWGVEEDDEQELHVTRFEWSFRCYQANFPQLRYLQDYSFDGFLGLLNYATWMWGDLRLPGASRRNKQRWDLHPLWETILAHIAEWSLNYDQVVRPQYDLKPDIKASYLRSLAGWLAGMQARLGVEQDQGEAASLAQVLSYMHEQGETMAAIGERANEKWTVFSKLARGS